MNTAHLLAFSFSRWFWQSWTELCDYFDHMGTMQWAVISASTVVFGFLCLKGQSIR